jgi:hypothetical protein
MSDFDKKLHLAHFLLTQQKMALKQKSGLFTCFLFFVSDLNLTKPHNSTYILAKFT